MLHGKIEMNCNGDESKTVGWFYNCSLNENGWDAKNSSFLILSYPTNECGECLIN